MSHVNNDTAVALEKLVKTLLYEGYSLYPYHSSAPKNKTPIPFGMLYPEKFCEHNEYLHHRMQTECIVLTKKNSLLDVRIKFLQTSSSPSGRTTEGWQAIEREITPGQTNMAELLKHTIAFHFSIDKENPYPSVTGIVTLTASPVKSKNAVRLSVCIENKTRPEDSVVPASLDAIQYTFVSTHTILNIQRGKFVSDQEPGPEWEAVVRKNKNENTWPVLIDKSCETMLSSPIILYDHPEINPVSKGDLFDSTEMEEALWLHLAAMTDRERRLAGMGDHKVKEMLERANELTPIELASLHDKMKNK